MRYVILLTVLFVSLILPGCDGGSSSHHRSDGADGSEPPTDSSPSGPAPPAGEIAANCTQILPADGDTHPAVDGEVSISDAGLHSGSPVAGVHYETAAHQGVTDSNGAFEFDPDEAIRFALGDTLLGEITARGQVTPFDLAGSPVLVGASAIGAAFESEQDPFHTVVNLTVLLHSLDSDGNPGNGIDIRPEVSALFEGVALDVSQHWKMFYYDASLRNVLAQANAQGLFSEPRGLVNIAYTMQALYGGLGLDAGLVGLSELHRDDNGDCQVDLAVYLHYDERGNVIRRDDGTSANYQTMQYDASGNLIRAESDSLLYGVSSLTVWQYNIYGGPLHRSVGGLDNGMIDETETWQYNSAGALTHREKDYNADGIAEEFEGWQYDVADRLVRYELEERYESGAKSGADLATWSFDTNGNLIRHGRLSGLNASWEDVETWQYDAEDRLVGHVERAFIGWWPGLDVYRLFLEGISITTYSYDVDGTLSGYLDRSEYDIEEDGVIDVHTAEYSADGELLRETWDENDDGDVELIRTWRYQYDAEGNLTWRERDEEDDGTPDEIVHRLYDVRGNLIRVELDLDGDGSTDEIQSWLYEYDTAGKLTRYEEDADNDGIPNETYIFRYNDSGVLLYAEWIDDWDGDGEPEQTRSWDYDATGNLVRRWHWQDNDDHGIEEGLEMWGYDDHGNLLWEEGGPAVFLRTS